MVCASASWRDIHLDDLPELIDGAVNLTPPSADLHVGFVHVPAIANGVAAGPGGVDKERREVLYPPVHRDVMDLDSTLDQKFLNVAIREPEP